MFGRLKLKKVPFQKTCDFLRRWAVTSVCFVFALGLWLCTALHGMEIVLKSWNPHQKMIIEHLSLKVALLTADKKCIWFSQLMGFIKISFERHQGKLVFIKLQRGFPVSQSRTWSYWSKINPYFKKGMLFLCFGLRPVEFVFSTIRGFRLHIYYL